MDKRLETAIIDYEKRREERERRASAAHLVHPKKTRLKTPIASTAIAIAFQRQQQRMKRPRTTAAAATAAAPVHIIDDDGQRAESASTTATTTIGLESNKRTYDVPGLSFDTPTPLQLPDGRRSKNDTSGEKY